MKKVLVVAALAAMLVGCGPQPQRPEETVTAPVVPERPEVQARRGALEVELDNKRGMWAERCISGRDVPVMFEADRPAICLRTARGIYPDNVTKILLSEFNGKLVD